MLATHQRDPLPKSLSYPVTLTDLREALGDRFAEEDVEVSFSAYHYARGARLETVIKTRKPYVIIRLEFRRWDKSVSTGSDAYSQRFLAGFWDVLVCAIPREHRASVRGEVLAMGLPAVAAWASQPRAPGWFFGRKVCELVYDPCGPAVRVVEREERT